MTTTAPSTGYSPSGGVETYYEVHGSGGTPLVLLHGGLLTIDLTWRALLPGLAAGRRVIAIEGQGHGHTALTDREMTFPALAGDVVGVLDHLGIEKADLFGFSLGALVATETVLRHPERVGRVVLASAAFQPDGNIDFATFPERLPSPEDFDAMLRGYADAAPDPSRFEEFSARTNVLVHGFTGWPVADLAAITAPTLVLVGDTDFVTVEHAVTMAATVPGAQLAVLPGATHMDVPQRVDVVRPMVERFLARPAAG